MPNGFPTFPVRDDFGPDPVNQYPVRDPAKELDGETVGRLMLHQIAGAGLLSHLAAVAFNSSGQILSSGTDRAEAWNTKRATTTPYGPPSIVFNSTGIATITYAATYPDHTGQAQPVRFRGGYADVTAADGVIWVPRVVPTFPYGPTVQVVFHFWNGSGFSLANPSTAMVVLR